MSLLKKKIVNDDLLLTNEEVEKYKCRILVLSDEIKFLSNKKDKSKSDYNKLKIKAREWAMIYKKLKKARKEALKYENNNR